VYWKRWRDAFRLTVEYLDDRVRDGSMFLDNVIVMAGMRNIHRGFDSDLTTCDGYLVVCSERKMGR